jgi:hypothetical protein
MYFRPTPFMGGGPFRIRPLRPRLIDGRSAAPVIRPQSRVDHAFLDVGTVVPSGPSTLTVVSAAFRSTTSVNVMVARRRWGPNHAYRLVALTFVSWFSTDVSVLR